MPDIRAIVSQLISEGWAPVPIVPGEKRPSDPDWLKRVYTPEDFSPTDSIGVKNGAPSAWRVDVDCDAPEAVKAAAFLALTTEMIHGRPGKLRSHYWYIAPNAKTCQFKDIDNSVLIEIRSTGGQTVVPPSIHVSGEDIKWELNREARGVDAEDLHKSVVYIAIAALFARHWPAGGRHVASGHLGGFLSRVGIEASIIEQIVRTIVTIVGEGQWADDNARFARESADKNERGEKTTGGPSLAESFADGEKLVARVYQWLGKEGDDQIDQLNNQHFVAQVGKDMVVAGEGDPLVFQTFTSFEQRYYNVLVGKKKLGKFWLEHPRRRTYRNVVFAPPPVVADPRDYNLWRGFAVSPDENPHPETRCARYLEHIHTVICNGNDAHYAYVLDLLAITVQQPGTPTGKALALRGGQGVGKSVFVESFGRLFGRHFTTVSSRKHITGDFNAHLSGKVVVFADEALWGGNRQDVGTLKRLITERTVIVERKGIDAVEEKNCIHLFMATNEKWVFPAGDYERRGVVLDVTRKMGRDYFNALVAEREGAAFAPALLALLQQRDVSSGRWREGLDTEGLREQQQFSADIVRQWWKQKLDEGVLSPAGNWPKFIDNDWLYTNYVDEMGNRGAGHTHRGTRIEFIHKLKSYLPEGVKVVSRTVPINIATYGQPIFKDMRRNGFMLPSLDACRHHFDLITGSKYAWERVEIEDLDPALLELANTNEDDL